MRLVVVGKVGGVTGWAEDCAAGMGAAGHEARLIASRNPALHPALEALLHDEAVGAPGARRIARAVARWAPRMVLAVGAFEIPRAIVERLARAPGRPPLVAWVGDAFAETARAAAERFDLVAYTDSGLLARHKDLGFSPPAIFLPHAANPARAAARVAPERRRAMVFVANPTPHRRAVIAAIEAPIALYGRGWRGVGGDHEVHARRVGRAELPTLYAGCLAALNIRHETNVLVGLNQRSFDPALFATPVVGDNQPDLALCFEPGTEVFVWRDTDELNAIHARLLADPALARGVGEAARRRVLGDHTYGARLDALTRVL
ncbi:MAG: glycosyltransferase [Caulobacteraceae bacterium]